MKIILILIFFTFSSSLYSEEKLGPTDLTLVLSGGVSLGSYGAGHLYQMFKFLNNQPNIKLKVITGASAGAINGLISILDSCQELEDDPTKSINWLTWIPFGIRDIANVKTVSPISIFDPSGASKSLELIKSRYSLGLKKSCDIVFGIVLTRKDPIQIQIKPGVSVFRHQEFFAVRIKGLGRGVFPRIENFPLKIKNQQQLLLPLSESSEENYNALQSVVVASAQFPLAFPPQKLNYCDLSDNLKNKCTIKNSKDSDFIDGGIFNNIPADLAQNILTSLHSQKNVKQVFALINLDGQTYPPSISTQKKEKSNLPKMLDYTLGQINSFVGTSRSNSLQSFYLQKQNDSGVLLTNYKVIPSASRYYYAFSGFMDKDFRVYDFILGQFEVNLFLNDNKFDSGHLDENHTDNISNDLIKCFNEFFKEEGLISDSCSYISRKNSNLFNILIVNSELSKHRCLENVETLENYWSCKKLKKFRMSSSIDDESDQEFFSRRLNELNYSFELSKRPDQTLESIIRQEVQPLVMKLSYLQNVNDESFLARLGQDLIFDSLDFQPQKIINTVGLGSHLQFNRSYLLNQVSINGFWLFAGGGIMFRNIDSYLTNRPNTLTLSPFLSTNLNWISESKSWIQPEVGIRYGFNFSKRKGSYECTSSVQWEPGSLCNSFFFQPNISISFLKFMRFEIGWIVYTENTSIRDTTYLFQINF